MLKENFYENEKDFKRMAQKNLPSLSKNLGK
jgi:hypothetical protein